MRALGVTKFEREPESYKKAMESANRIEWQLAMEDQYKSLVDNNTWILVDRSDVPPGKQILRGKWVYNIKTWLGPDPLYKAR